MDMIPHYQWGSADLNLHMDCTHFTILFIPPTSQQASPIPFSLILTVDGILLRHLKELLIFPQVSPMYMWTK